VTSNGAKRSIAEILRNRWVIEHGRLHDASWEHDLITRWVVVGIDSLCTHVPLILVNRLADLRPLFLDVLLHNGQLVGEEGGRQDANVTVIVYEFSCIGDVGTLSRISYL
jgi:hypothetical protein